MTRVPDSPDAHDFEVSGSQNDGMTNQRLWAGVLVTLEAGGMAWLSNMQREVPCYWWDTAVFPALVVLAAVFAVARRPTWTPEPGTVRWLVLLLAGLSLLKLAIAPHEYLYFAPFLYSSLAHATAGFLLTWQLLELFRRRPVDDGRLPTAFVATAALVMICVADIQITASQRDGFELISIAFALSAVLFLDASHRRVSAGRPRLRRIAVSVVVLVVAGGLGLAGSRGLYHYARDFEGLFRDSRPNGGGRGRLIDPGIRRLGDRSWGRRGDDARIAVRVYAADRPGYLKLKTFDRYENSTWLSAPTSRRLGVIEDPPAALNDPRDQRPVYSLAPAGSSGEAVVDIWPDRVLSGRVPLPPGASHVRLAATAVSTNRDGTLVADDLPPGHPISVLVSPSLRPLPVSDRRRLTTASDDASGRLIRRLEPEVFSGCTSDSERLDAVENYFHEQFVYRLDVVIPPRREALEWFLREKPPAHCEYFATAAALLLRQAGIPCRYVTGYVVTEKNTYGDYWVARHKDAHAWVEAYDRSRGWVIVEATPANGVPTAAPPTQATQLWESIRDRLRMRQILIEQAGWIALAIWILELLSSVPGLVVVVATGVLLVRWGWRHRGRRRRLRPPPPHPVLLALRQLLARVDARQAEPRRPTETLHQFARRLDHAEFAAWYRRYADARYRRELDEGDVRRLAESIPAR